MPVQLRHFILLCLAAGVWIAGWGVERQLEPLRRSVPALRAEAGRLFVHEPHRIYVLESPTLRLRHYQYQVYVPRAPRFELHLKTRGIESGSPSNLTANEVGSDSDQNPSSEIRYLIAPGEHRIDLKAIEQQDRTHVIQLEIDGRLVDVLAETENWDAPRATWTSTGTSGEQADYPARDTIQLLRLRFGNLQPDTPTSGLLLWLSEL